MVHFCIFSARQGQLGAGRNYYVTIFGGAEFRRPALARRLAGTRASDDGPFCFFFTMFGSAEIKWPTLAEEYLALVEALRAGGLSLESWDRALAQSDAGFALQTATFTLFGSLETDKLPSEDAELDDLSLQRHAGHIPEAAIEHLMLAIGHGGEQRLAAVRQAAAATLAST